jgi:tripartite-type tricarboxylate transporter receptor subunit TctC
MNVKTFSAAVLALCAVSAAHAQQKYPFKTIRFIVPYAPGGSTDFLARMVGAKFTEAWKQPVIIDNRGGAGGILGADLAAKSPPDGYTVVLTAMSHATAIGFHKKMPYSLTTDLDAVSLIAAQPNALAIHPSLPAKSLKEFIALARARPGELAYSSPGTGSTQHVMGEYFRAQAKVNAIHVGYKGTSLALNDLISGQVMFSFQPVINAVPTAQSGRIRVLAVTGGKRSSAAPDIPTMMEAGLPQYNVSSWYGVHAPARTPAVITAQLSKEIIRALAQEDIRQRLVSLGMEPAANSPEEFSAFVASEVARWTKLIQDAGLKAE